MCTIYTMRKSEILIMIIENLAKSSVKDYYTDSEMFTLEHTLANSMTFVEIDLDLDGAYDDVNSAFNEYWESKDDKLTLIIWKYVIQTTIRGVNSDDWISNMLNENTMSVFKSSNSYHDALNILNYYVKPVAYLIAYETTGRIPIEFTGKSIWDRMDDYVDELLLMGNLEDGQFGQMYDIEKARLEHLIANDTTLFFSYIKTVYNSYFKVTQTYNLAEHRYGMKPLIQSKLEEICSL